MIMMFILMMVLNLTTNLVRMMTRAAMRNYQKEEKGSSKEGTVAKMMTTVKPATKKEDKTTKRNYRLYK